MRKLFFITKFILICFFTVILPGQSALAAEQGIEEKISESMRYLSEKNYVEALKKLQSVDSDSLEVKYLILGLTNPRHWRYGAQDPSLNYLEQYNQILFELSNDSVSTRYYKNVRDFKCAVLQSLLFEMSSDQEGMDQQNKASAELFRCLGRGEAGYFSTFASLLIKDMADEIEVQDRRRMSTVLYETSLSLVMLLQASLTVLDYDPGPIDGLFGNKTNSAYIKFELDNGLRAPYGIVNYSNVSSVAKFVLKSSALSQSDRQFISLLVNRLELQVGAIEKLGYFSVSTADTRGSHGDGSSAVQTIENKIDTSLASELKFWDMVERQNTPEFYGAYLDQYPNGTFSSLAKLLLGQINQKEQSSNSTSTENNLLSYKALIIANEDYDFWQDLKTPIQDQARIGTILEQKYGVVVKELTDVSREEFLKASYDFFKSANKDDHLIFYYAGHGEKIDETGFWLPVDAEKNNDFQWIDVGQIKRYAKQSKASKILFLVDSCFSEAISRGISFVDSESSLNEGSGKVRVAISSGKFTQSSVDVGPKDKRYSPFARAVYDSLYGFETSFSSQELFSKILTHFPKNLEQEPTWGVIAASNHQNGDFEFLTVR